MKHNNLQLFISYLSSNDEWHSTQEIASYLHTTTRTVQNYAKEVNQNAPSPLILTSRKGYRWNTAGANQRPFYSLERSLPQTPEERCSYILRQLLYGRKVSLTLLGLHLSVSDRTLEADFQALKPQLKPYQLRLRRSRDTLVLEGRQSDKRRLSAHLIMQATETEFLSLRFIAGCFPEYDVLAVAQSLHTVLEQYGLLPNGYAEYDLLLHVVLQVQQIHAGQSMALSETDGLELHGFRDFSAAKALAGLLSALCDIAYNEWEIAYLAALLISKTDSSKPIETAANGGPSSPQDSSIQDYALQTLNALGRYIPADYSSQDFPQLFTAFFQRVLVRQKMRLYTPNPLYPNLRLSYPKLYDICLGILEDFSRLFQTEPHPSEIGFLVLLLAQRLNRQILFENPVPCTLVCPSYYHIAADLSLELTSRLGNAIVLHRVIETLDLEQLSGCTELIVSVVPSDNFPHVVTIAPFPKSEDYRRIRKEIRKIKLESYSRQLYGYFTQYLSPQYFRIGHAFSDRDAALSSLCGEWQREGIVTEEFKGRILRREEIGESSFCRTLALPHRCEDCVKQSSIYLLLNKTPMPWGQDRVNFLILLAFRPAEREPFWKLYDLLIKLFSEPKNASALLGATDYISFLDILSSLGRG